MTVYAIDCIKNFTNPDDYELVVIESGKVNPDPVRDLSKLLRPDVDQYISFENNYAQPASMNLGISKTIGKYISLVDNDCFVGPGWLEGVKRCLSKGNDFVGCHSYRESYETYQTRLNKYNADAYVAGGADFNYIVFSGTLFTRKNYEEIGPFDEKLTFNKWDVDYNMRILNAGKLIGTAVDTPVFHPRSTTYWFTELPEGVDNYWDGPLAEQESLYFKEKWKM
jgi:GT2 family glycosyltransferase